MTKSQANAEVFLMAFKAMPRAERDAVLAGITQDKTLRGDLMDLALIADRRNERSRPFRVYLKERKSK